MARPSPMGPSKNGQRYVTWADSFGTFYRLEGAAADLIYTAANDVYNRALRKGKSLDQARAAMHAESERLLILWGGRYGHWN